MERKRDLLANGFLICGTVLVLCALGIFLYTQAAQNKACHQMEEYVAQLQQSLPEEREAFGEERREDVMPIMEVSGEDFVGIMEVPAYEVELPIGSRWTKEKYAEYPCRYLGNLYDGSLIIGGSDYKGQLDFIGEISIGDAVCITDMTGARYSYTVSWIEKTEEVYTEYQADEKVGLTIFARNQYGFDYTVVRCE